MFCWIVQHILRTVQTYAINGVTLEPARNLQQSNQNIVKTYITVSLQSSGMKIQIFFH